MNRKGSTKLIIYLAILFALLLTLTLMLGIRYIDAQLLKSNEGTASDLSKLVGNNFHITDEEVAHMKSLTFNEMVKDDINMRLMNVGSGIDLYAPVISVYLVAPLKKNEIKYHVTQDTAEFFGREAGTPLDAIWLLNGRIGGNGEYEAVERDDLYRYTAITEELKYGFENRVSFGIFTSDEWGAVITGYTPIYTEEGNFVGLLGIDMAPDVYQNSVHDMVFILIGIFSVTVLVLLGVFVSFYIKYSKAHKARIYFDFYSKMSHDMRTPMNGILGMVHLAETENDTEELHRYFAKVGESSQYLLRLINDTLDISRIGNGKMILNPASTECMELIDNIVDMVRITALKKQISFEVEKKNLRKECWLLIDPVRFQQIFMNLLSNAIKYTPAGGQIRFIVEGMGKEGEVLHIRGTVQDTGVGMSSEFIKKSLYKPYAQEHNGFSDQYAGSGLGLVITKSIVDQMGGKITVSSKEGEGTTFVVELALMETECPHRIENEKKSVEFTGMALKGKHILLCEDHPLNAEIAVKLLTQKGCMVDVAENGKLGADNFWHHQEIIMMQY